MEPSDSFWDALAASITHSSGELVVAILGIIAVVFVLVKWGMPFFTKVHEDSTELKKLEIENRRKTDIENGLRAEERLQIDAKAQEVQREHTQALNGLMLQNAALVEQIQASQERSAGMAHRVESIADDNAAIRLQLDRIDGNVTDIHTAILHRPEIDD